MNRLIGFTVVMILLWCFIGLFNMYDKYKNPPKNIKNVQLIMDDRVIDDGGDLKPWLSRKCEYMALPEYHNVFRDMKITDVSAVHLNKNTKIYKFKDGVVDFEKPLTNNKKMWIPTFVVTLNNPKYPHEPNEYPELPTIVRYLHLASDGNIYMVLNWNLGISDGYNYKNSKNYRFGDRLNSGELNGSIALKVKG